MKVGLTAHERWDPPFGIADLKATGYIRAGEYCHSKGQSLTALWRVSSASPAGSPKAKALAGLICLGVEGRLHSGRLLRSLFRRGRTAAKSYDQNYKGWRETPHLLRPYRLILMPAGGLDMRLI